MPQIRFQIQPIQVHSSCISSIDSLLFGCHYIQDISHFWFHGSIYSNLPNCCNTSSYQTDNKTNQQAFTWYQTFYCWLCCMEFRFFPFFLPTILHPSGNVYSASSCTRLCSWHISTSLDTSHVHCSHDRYPLIVKIWKPAYKCFICIRREWNIRGSLVQAFATFLVLSYVKILNVSFNLLSPVFLQTAEGEFVKQPYLYFDGRIPYFGKKHLPYGILAIIMLVTFNILPITILLLYPCRCFQASMNRCGLHSHVLHTFIDAFQGCYRYKPRDCRYFSAVYLIVRILQLVTFAVVRDLLFVPIMGFYFILLTAIIILVKPYKKKLYNKIDAWFFLAYTFGYFLIITNTNMSAFLSHKCIIEKVCLLSFFCC